MPSLVAPLALKATTKASSWRRSTITSGSDSSFIDLGAFTAFTLVNFSVIAYFLRHRLRRGVGAVLGWVALPLARSVVEIGRGPNSSRDFSRRGDLQGSGVGWSLAAYINPFQKPSRSYLPVENTKILCMIT
jgi:hypothetical protein